MQRIGVAGAWAGSRGTTSFQAVDPTTGATLAEQYPISTWDDLDTMLGAAAEAFEGLRTLPRAARARFLDRYAERIEARAAEIVAAAHAETGLPAEPRLATVELPRTTGQLRQAAEAARTGSWAMPTIDTKTNIRSHFEAIGPVAIFGPNNFPLAFNAISGGDFAAAIAAGCPVIAKGHPAHPTTTRLLAEEALAAVLETDLPAASVQVFYHCEPALGRRLVADARLGAAAFTGSRRGGLALKEAADAVGKPIYLEMGSINPLVLLPGALRERGKAIAEEYQTSALMAAGQFCTSPGLVLLIEDDGTEAFLNDVAERFRSAPSGTLLAPGVRDGLGTAVETLTKAGAELLAGGRVGDGPRLCFTNTLLRASASAFLDAPASLSTEAFGNAALCVVADDLDQLAAVIDALEGNLTGCIYSDTQGSDDPAYDAVAPRLAKKVGRLLNDKMPTGVAVVPAMNHGGPYPATGHPGFTAVGIPASLRRFGRLTCYDNVRPHRLPVDLRDDARTDGPWRLIDGAWTRAGVVQE